MRRLAAALLALAAAPASAQTPSAPPAPVPAPVPASVVLTGLDGRGETLTAAQLAARPHRTVTLAHEGRTTAYSGVPLSDLMRDLRAPMGALMHGQAVNDVLFVTAADRYRVVLSLAEVDPSVHAGALAILADQADGKPLDAHEGPFRLVVGGDLKPARAARQVVEIDLKQLP